MVAVLKALPTIKTESGVAGFQQVVLHPTEIKASAIAISRLIGSSDLNRLTYLMT